MLLCDQIANSCYIVRLPAAYNGVSGDSGGAGFRTQEWKLNYPRKFAAWRSSYQSSSGSNLAARGSNQSTYQT